MCTGKCKKREAEVLEIAADGISELERGEAFVPESSKVFRSGARFRIDTFNHSQPWLFCYYKKLQNKDKRIKRVRLFILLIYSSTPICPNQITSSSASILNTLIPKGVKFLQYFNELTGTHQNVTVVFGMGMGGGGVSAWGCEPGSEGCGVHVGVCASGSWFGWARFRAGVYASVWVVRVGGVPCRGLCHSWFQGRGVRARVYVAASFGMGVPCWGLNVDRRGVCTAV